MTWLAPQSGSIPHPTASTVTAPYWDGCRVGELRFQQCVSCGAQPLRPVPRCPSCANEVVWRTSSGSGTLYSWTVVWRPALPVFQVPYAPAIVRLDEGALVMSSIVGCETDALSADMPLAVQFEVYGECALPYFTTRAVARKTSE